MARIGIVGGGAFGTALACVLRRAGREVRLWAREPEVVASINGQRTNPLFLAGIELAAGIEATGDLGRAVEGAALVLLAPPAQHMRAVAAALRPHLAAGTPVVSCSKGIERGSLALMPEVLGEALPRAEAAVLSGPSFAREIARELPCAVALACADAALAARLARTIASPDFCVYPTDDVAGVAIGGVMKNVIAIASGIAAGRGQSENARATLATLGLDEALRLGLAKGARAETFLGLAGAGDLMLTVGSLQSRNTALGVALAEGKAPPQVLTEGAYSAAAVAALARKLDVEMPITFALESVLTGTESIDAAIARLLAFLGRRR
jgi:glycerol-3-phosphate dehydrogenase (NAD(P)+)